MNSASNSIKASHKGQAPRVADRLPLDAMGIRLTGFALVCALPFIFAPALTYGLIGLIFREDAFAQIPLIPFVTLFLIYGSREGIFSEVSRSAALGSGLVAAGAACLLADRLNPWELGDANQGSLFVFAFLLVWMGAFALFFGTRAFSAARFPLLFLLFAVPIPQPLLSRIIYFLQERSADIAEQFFRLGGVPYFRQGLIFQLPGVAIRVAEECSGIRSSMALFITTVLAAYLFLNTTWRKVVLCLVVVPLAIVKNGLRIMVLTTLAIYVDPSFLRGNLHHHGGVVFFLIALVPLGLLLVWFQKSEKVISSRFAASQSA